jgi:hypothetical protein
LASTLTASSSWFAGGAQMWTTSTASISASTLSKRGDVMLLRERGCLGWRWRIDAGDVQIDAIGALHAVDVDAGCETGADDPAAEVRLLGHDSRLPNCLRMRGRRCTARVNGSCQRLRKRCVRMPRPRRAN